MERFDCHPLNNFKERHRAKGTLQKLFLGGWGLILALGMLAGPRELHLVEALVCWSALFLYFLFLVGIALDAALCLLWHRFQYHVGADKRGVYVLWRGGKGNLGFPRKGLHRVAFRTEPKTGEGFIGFQLRRELIDPSNTAAQKFFEKFRKRYNCEYALTDRQIGARADVRALTDFLRGPGRLRVENAEEIQPLPAKRYHPAFLIGAGLLYVLSFVALSYVSALPAPQKPAVAPVAPVIPDAPAPAPAATGNPASTTAPATTAVLPNAAPSGATAPAEAAPAAVPAGATSAPAAPAATPTPAPGGAPAAAQPARQ